MRQEAWVLGFALAAALTNLAGALSDGLAATPLLGWNSWNSFHDNVNETLIKDTADLLVNLGLAGVGYSYVVIDGRPPSLQAASARRRRLRDWSPVDARRRWLGGAQARGVRSHRVQPDALPVGHRRARRLRARQRRGAPLRRTSNAAASRPAAPAEAAGAPAQA